MKFLKQHALNAYGVVKLSRQNPGMFAGPSIIAGDRRV
jgi:hypothetical protein